MNSLDCIGMHGAPKGRCMFCSCNMTMAAAVPWCCSRAHAPRQTSSNTPQHITWDDNDKVVSLNVNLVAMHWLQVMFAKPFPVFSCKLNAWVTALTCQWLMGPSAVNDVEVEGSTVAAAQGVKVERCA